MKILVFLLLSAIFFLATFSEVDCSDSSSESNWDYSTSSPEFDTPYRAESSTGKSRKGKKPVERVIFKRHGESSSRRAPDTEVPAREPTIAEMAQFDMKDLYEVLQHSEKILHRRLNTGGNQDEIKDLRSKIKKTKNDIVQLRSKLRKIFGLSAKYGREMPKVNEEIENIKWQLRHNEERLNNINIQNDPERYSEIVNDGRELEQHLKSLNKKKSRYQRKMNCWEKPEIMMESFLPLGIKYV